MTIVLSNSSHAKILKLCSYITYKPIFGTWKKAAVLGEAVLGGAVLGGTTVALMLKLSNFTQERVVDFVSRFSLNTNHWEASRNIWLNGCFMSMNLRHSFRAQYSLFNTTTLIFRMKIWRQL